MATREKIEVENVNCPGQTTRLDAEKYRAMKKALLRVLPKTAPGLSQAEIFTDILPHLPDALWPGGAKSAWWATTVRLDLEAKGIVTRTRTTPLTWHRT